MSSPRHPRDLCGDIYFAAETIRRLTVPLTRATFRLSDAEHLACRHELIIIGEASSNLPLVFRRAHKGIRWRAFINVRNILVHGYIHVDANRVWTIIEREIPPLLETLSPIYESLLEEEP